MKALTRRLLALQPVALVALVAAACGGSTAGPIANDGGVSSLNPLDPKNPKDPKDAAAADATPVQDGGTKSPDTTCSAKTAEGDPCSVEGAFCNPSPCTDPCQFCNSLYCSSGKWEQMEAFPMPEAYCGSVSCGALTCGKGEFCVRTFAGPAGGGPGYRCDKFPSGCFDCACASDLACGSPPPQAQCTPDPATNKPMVDCYEQ